MSFYSKNKGDFSSNTSCTSPLRAQKNLVQSYLIPAFPLVKKNQCYDCLLRIGYGIIRYQVLSGSLIMTTLPLGHAKYKRIPVPPLLTLTLPLTTWPYRKAKFASHNKLAIALVEYIAAIDIPRTFIADNRSFPIASNKYVLLHKYVR